MGLGPGRRVLLVATVVVVVLAVVVLAAASGARDDRRADALERLQTLAQANAADAGQFVASRLEVLGVVAATLEGAEDVATVRRRLGRQDPVRLQLAGGLRWFGPLGAVVPGGAVPPPVVAEVRRSRQPALGRLAGDGRAAGVPLAVPAPGGAVLVGTLPRALVQRVSENVTRRQGARAFVVDRDGTVLAGPGDVAGRPVAGDLRRLLRPGSFGARGGVTGPDGRRDVAVGFGDSRFSGWAVVLERPLDEVTASADRRLRRTAGLVLLVGVGGLGVAFLVARRLDVAAATERRIAERLQRSLLPDAVPPLPDLDVAVRLLPGEDGLAVGGDLYEVLERDDGRVVLCVGDVVGRGIDAAAAMGRLRAALVALVPGCDGPGALLGALDRYADRAEATQAATAVVVELDREGRGRLAAAGHPAPLLVGAGRARFLLDGRSAPLGTGLSAGPRSEGTFVLAPGEALVLFSDGLVERRGPRRDDELAAAAEGADLAAGAEALADRLLEALGPFGDDDVAVLVVRRR